MWHHPRGYVSNFLVRPASSLGALERSGTPSRHSRGIDTPVAITRGGAQMKWFREPRCSFRVRPVCRGILRLHQGCHAFVGNLVETYLTKETRLCTHTWVSPAFLPGWRAPQVCLSYTCVYPTAKHMPDAHPQDSPVQRRLMAVGITIMRTLRSPARNAAEKQRARVARVWHERWGRPKG